MSNEKRKIEDLNLLDDFLFAEASADEATAEVLVKLVIERATGVQVGELLIEPQKIINGVDTNCHGIRLDVSVREMKVTEKDKQMVQLFDIEPNNIQKVHLPKRSRYYQALTDVKLLESGVDYDKMPDMWTIWILSYDPFGKGYMMYSVKNRVEEFPEIEYNDGVRKLFLYTDGKIGGNCALENLLKYMKDSKEENAVDEELKKLHSNIERLKGNKKIGVKYMQMQEVMKYKIEEAVEEAVEAVTQQVTQQVEERMAKLTDILLNEERFEELRRMTKDEEYRKELFVKYKI